jgi:hypothetical protein
MLEENLLLWSASWRHNKVWQHVGRNRLQASINSSSIWPMSGDRRLAAMASMAGILRATSMSDSPSVRIGLPSLAMRAHSQDRRQRKLRT